MSLSPRDELAYWRNLVVSPGWKLLEEKVKDVVFHQVGIEDPNVLKGMKRAIQLPGERIAGLEETLQRAIDENGPKVDVPDVEGRLFYG